MSTLQFEAEKEAPVFHVIDAAEHSSVGNQAAEQLQREQQSLELAGDAAEGDVAAEARRRLQ